MKTILITFLFTTVFAALADAAAVTARYLRFEGYSTNNTSSTTHIGIYEIEAYSNGLNAARTATVTANSVYPSNTLSYLNYLKDGNTTSNAFFTSRNSPGPASEAAPHWVQMDFGSAIPIDRLQVYLFGGFSVSFGLFLSSDGTNWTQVARHNNVTGTIQNDPSAPFVVIQSAAMRPGTTLMDVVYRVNDPDDTTVKTRALAFVDGVRSFANVLKPVTFVEGTAAKLGDAIPTNVNHTLTWDVATDWSVQLGQVKFEVLAMDARGLLPIDWITIPAAGGKPALAISKDTPTSISVLNALFWRYADGDVGMTLTSGVLRGNSTSGNFFGVDLANGATVGSYAPPFVFKRMNLDPAESSEVSYASGTARAGLLNTVAWHATNRPYAGTSVLAVWGGDGSLALGIPAGLNGVTAIAEGYSHGLALKSDGTVVGWGNNYNGQVIPPAGLSGVTAIAAGWYHSLALKSDGTVVGWGANDYGQITIPAGLTGVTKISAYGHHNLALKSNGTVVGWGDNVLGEITIPAGLTGVIAIAAGSNHGMALKGNGTVTVWGYNGSGQLNIPVGLTGVTSIAAGTHHCLALKNNGTVAAWGWDLYGQNTVPSGLTGVTAIAAGSGHNLALKNDGTVVGWGDNNYGQSTAPSNLRGVTAISANDTHNLVLKAKAP